MNTLTHATLDLAVKLAAFVIAAMAAKYTPPLVALVRARIKNALAREALAHLVALLGQFVLAEANSVRELKDPAKPGTWTAETARAALAHVIEQVKAAAPEQVAAVEAGLAHGQSIDAVLRQLTEAQVEALRQNQPHTLNLAAFAATLLASSAPAPAATSEHPSPGAVEPPSGAAEVTVR